MRTPPARVFLSLLIAGFLSTPLRCPADDAATAKALFQNPPRDYSTGPLWVWNDLLTESEIRDTLRDLAGQQIKQVWVHPRPGLMMPYLSPDWFRLWKIALDEARRLDMNVWIYDENSYPSGFAGGLVLDAMPDARGRGLSFQEAYTAPAWSKSLLGVYRVDGEQYEWVTAKVRAGETLPPAHYLVVGEMRAPNLPWQAGRGYVNLLSPGVTEKFLELTLEAYRREVGSEFGHRIPGVFSDEPNIRAAGNFPWSEVLTEAFQRRCGYNLLEHLPALAQRIGDWQKVRHNYYQVLNDQFIEHWSKPYHEYCQSNHLEWTGHYWDHEWPNCGAVPDNMAMYAWHQRPGIDCLMNQYAENTHAQFGNVRMVRELSSVANQLGMKRTLCEVYGCGGWDLRLEDMKRIGDWLEVLGVNTPVQHLSFVTIRGARKRDHPQSFSYHEPWWPAYHVSASYLARLSAALSQGEQINRVLVLEPTTTAWMYQGEGPKLDELGNAFCKMLMALEAAQVEYDIGDEYILSRFGKILPGGTRRGEVHSEQTAASIDTGAELQIGARSYSTIVVPAQVENLDSQTAGLLEAYLQGTNAGKLWALGEPPSRIDGALSDRGLRLTNNAAWRRIGSNDLVDALADPPGAGEFAIQRSARDQGLLFHHRRRLKDGQLLLLVNTSITAPSSGSFNSELKSVEAWDLYSGKTEPYPFVPTDHGIKAEFNLPPSGSLLLLLSAKPGGNGSLTDSHPSESSSGPSEQPSLTVPTLGTMEIRRVEPNVLTLDYVDVTAGGVTKSNLYAYEANQFVWKQHGLEHDPWDNAVQFKDELITKTFPANSGFTAAYKFTIEAAVPTNLAIVIERPDLYAISCNGRAITARYASASPPPPLKDWWLDKSFGRISISAFARTGENVVTIEARPLTMFHELEPAYVLGDFALKPMPSGFDIVPDEGLRLGAQGWNAQGHPFYSAGVAYHERFMLRKKDGRYTVVLPKWYGSVARVTVNGKMAGYIDAPPWQCDVTPGLKGGANDIEVTVIGTLKNTLGPHHGNPPPGSVWLASFNGPPTGPPPGAEYSTFSYGLFEPFELRELGSQTP